MVSEMMKRAFTLFIFLILCCMFISAANLEDNAEILLSGNVADGTGIQQEDGDITLGGLTVSIYYKVDPEDNALTLPNNATKVTSDSASRAIDGFDLVGAEEAAGDSLTLYIVAKTNNSKETGFDIAFKPGAWTYSGTLAQGVSQDPIKISQTSCAADNNESLIRVECKEIEDGVEFGITSPHSTKVLDEVLLGMTELNWAQSKEYLAGSYTAQVTIIITPQEDKLQ